MLGEWLGVWLVLLCCMSDLLQVVSSASVKKAGHGSEPQTLDLLMPGAKPKNEDEYICTSIKLPPGEQYIVNYEALANASTAHHMLLFGCQEPYVDKPMWRCGAVCGGGKDKIMFAWAKNAPPTHLPHDVGFRVGGKSNINHLVLQIHYLRSFKGSEPADRSGLRMTLTKTKQKYLAGIFLLLAYDFTIPPGKSRVHGDISCKYSGKAPIYPFAFRTHAHDLGRVITGYQYNGTYYTLGRGNPQWPQAFYPMKEKFVIKPGDYLIGRCTYSSLERRNRVTHIGATHNDEMCNFYMMYYTDSETGDVYGDCFGNHHRDLLKNLPPGYDTLLPPYPNFEENGPALSLVSSWPSIVPSDKLTLGQVAGVAVDAKGNVHIFHRASRVWNGVSFDADNKFREKDPIKENVLVVFDRDTGLVTKQWGAGMFYMPHGLHIDQHDNVWLTDVAMHQVFKFKAGVYDKPELTLGVKMEPGSDDAHFCKPTDVAVLKSGDFYVSDGYCNSRIMHFSPDGKKLLHKWGKGVFSSDTDIMDIPLGEFSIPHSLALVEDHQMLCVADRENGRVQCFDLEGQPKHQIKLDEFNGRLFAITYDNNSEVLYAVNGPSPYNSDAVQGFTIDPLQGYLLGTWNVPGESLHSPHDVAVSPDGKELYVGEIDPNKLWKFSVTLPNPAVKKAMEKKVASGVQEDIPEQDQTDKDLLPDEQQGDFGASLIIGLLLVVPVIIVIIITVVLRLRAKEKTRQGKYTKLMVDDQVRLMEN